MSDKAERAAALLLAAMLTTMALLGGIALGRFLPRHSEEPCKAAMQANYRAYEERGIVGFAETWPDVEAKCLADVLPRG